MSSRILQTLSDNPKASGVSLTVLSIIIIVLLICCSCCISSCFFLRERICNVASPCPETVATPVVTA